MKTYHGVRLNPEEKTVSDVRVTVMTPDRTYLLPHHVRHSPDGFNWGYHGSGPAELARCLLADVLGKPPHPAVYQRFKDLKVARWHDEWTIDEEAAKADVTIILAELNATCPFCVDRGHYETFTIFCDCATGQAAKQESADYI